ncbi:VanZ family protein [Paenibacillus mendelii]|uniref:VanZ family protein n=1 Tax=Paenibacillus mendelii TaxID=206163 RepID=A0ABV6J9X1_9BACL|nr:VanZ family protein [Paenibacillus mendelii]MCQ6563780.1 VanZ family protein [Paenibacillus mendelii]
MLQSYLFPISIAFLTFPVAALFFTLPFLIVQYRKHGYINKYRAILLYLFLLYMMNALYLVILPLPATIHNKPLHVSSYMQLIPFHFIQDIIRETNVMIDRPATYIRLLKERAFLQVMFNVMLLVPFGVFLRYYFQVTWVKCLFASLGLSLFFEITQVTGIFGIYDYPYRLLDVDDLITNTAGGMTGFMASEWISRHLPRVDKLDENLDLTKKRVSYTRRALAFLIDWFILLPILIVLILLNSPYPYVSIIVIYFFGITYVTNGLTAGKWVVRIRLKGSSERIKLSELVTRYGLLYLLVGGMNIFYIWAGINQLSPLFLIVLTLGMFGFNLMSAIHLLRCVFNPKRTLFYEAKSGTSHVII